MGVQFNLLYLRTQPMENIVVLAEEFWIPTCDLYEVGYGETAVTKKGLLCSDTIVVLL